MLANHYTASNEWHGLLTTGVTVFDNLRRITGLGLWWGGYSESGLPAANRLLIDVSLWVPVPVGGLEQAGWCRRISLVQSCKRSELELRGEPATNLPSEQRRVNWLGPSLPA